MNQSYYHRRRQNQSTIQNADKLQPTTNVQKKKNELIEQLSQAITGIGNIKKIESCVEDPIIISLQKIQKQAKLYNFMEIIKMANLAIGKRILNLELQRKRAEIENKIEKKRQIQENFRQNRIKKLSYEQIALQKLQSNTFIVKPYNDGKAFVQSILFYQKLISSITGKQYSQFLQQCYYLQTIKHVNKIFFNNFSNSSSEQSKKQAIYHPSLRLGFLLVLIILGLCVYMGYSQNAIVSYLVFIFSFILIIMMVMLSVWNYCNDKNSNNQLDQTMEEINQYFQMINDKNRKLGMRFQWNCPSHFLYLQVKFDNLQ